MKKILLFAFVLISIQTSFGQRKKIAVISISVNKLINTESLSKGLTNVESERLQNDMQAALSSPAFDFTNILRQVHTNIFTELKAVFPFDLADETLVLDNPEYKGFSNTVDVGKNMLPFVAAPGYKYVFQDFGDRFSEKSDLNRIIAIFSGKFDGFLLITQDFLFKGGLSYAGNGFTNLATRINFSLYDSSGRTLYNYTEGENSGNKVVILQGIPLIGDVEQTLGHCSQATDNTLKQIAKNVAKQSEKIEKRLNKN